MPGGVSDASLGVWVVVAGSAAVGAIHALLPDHWIPFVLLSKARRWDLGRSLAAVVAGGVAHLGSTAALGFLLAFLGAEAIRRVGPAAEFAGAAILAVFGLMLALRGMRSARAGEGHSHSGEHSHDHPGTRPPVRDDSPAHPHSYPHDRRRHAGRGHLLEGAVLGVRPCAEAIPIFLAAAAYGLTSSVLAVAAWVLATLGTTVIVVWFSLLGLRSFKPDFLERYGELAAGLVILLMGMGAAVLTYSP